MARQETVQLHKVKHSKQP